MMRSSPNSAATVVRSLSLRERVGVRGYGFSLILDPSPGALRRPLPMGEVNRLTVEAIQPKPIAL